jgi:hypothetical protein
MGHFAVYGHCVPELAAVTAVFVAIAEDIMATPKNAAKIDLLMSLAVSEVI